MTQPGVQHLAICEEPGFNTQHYLERNWKCYANLTYLDKKNHNKICVIFLCVWWNVRYIIHFRVSISPSLTNIHENTKTLTFYYFKMTVSIMLFLSSPDSFQHLHKGTDDRSHILTRTGWSVLPWKTALWHPNNWLQT